ncbi:p-loop containing nucleoside triphosphate hydrolase protein [Mycena venus]|uniref:p-loop containing nucleoside triphosphate hydrolase protein n=1 Tax=Mycena venus TaxID=2733690 RepID=A0A8H6YGB7_9AGAR|nr:p-loop containing nucleoside triphosphate hydrolase protein [Mycena venus]
MSEGTTPFPLKGWQEDAIQACMDAIHAGRTKIGVQIAYEQSNMLAGLVDRMLPNLNAKQILVVAEGEGGHQRMAHKILQQYPLWTVETHNNDKVETLLVSKADVFLTSYDGMIKDAKTARRHARNTEKGIKSKTRDAFEGRHDKSAVKVVILSDVDEFKSFDSFLSLLKPPCPPDADDPPPFPIIIGTSSTDDLYALKRLGFFEEVVYQRTFLDHLQETWGCNALFAAVPTHLGLRKVRIKVKSEFQDAGISKVMRQPFVVQKVVKEWLERAASRKSTLVYCVDDPHAKKLALAFKAAGIDARQMPRSLVEAEANTSERLFHDELMTAFDAGEFPVLLVSHGKEVVISRIDCVLLAAPAIDRQIVISSGMKPSPDTAKEDCLIIDIVDVNIKRSPAYSTCRLFQLEPHEIDGKPPHVLRQLSKQKALAAFEAIPPKPHVPPPPPPAACNSCRSDRPGRCAFKAPNQEEVDSTLKSVNQFFKKRRWVRCARYVYVHDCFEKGHAILRRVKVKDETLYEAYLSSRRLLEGTPAAGHGEARKLSVPARLEDVLQQLSSFLDQRTPARPNHPLGKASALQLTMLKELCPEETMSHVIFEGEPMQRDALFEWLTGAEASNAIARLRYRQEPDFPPFTYAEQEVIVTRIRNHKLPGEKIARKNAQREAMWIRKKEEAAHQREELAKHDDASGRNKMAAKRLETAKATRAKVGLEGQAKKQSMSEETE